MSGLKVRILVLIFVLALALGAVCNGVSVGHRGPELQLPATVLVVALVFSGIALWLGLQVKKFSSLQRRKDAQMNPLLAARTAVFAQTCAYTGVLLAGWHTALLIYQLGMLSARSLWSPFWLALLDVLAGVLMLVVGLLVESWCKIPPTDSDDDATGSQPALRERQSRGYARRGD